MAVAIGIGNTRKIKTLSAPKKQTKVSRIEEFIKTNPITRFMIGHLSDTIYFSTGLKKPICYLISCMIILGHFLVSTFIYKLFSEFVFLWYTKILLLVVSIILPTITYTIINDSAKSKLYKQLPTVFSEISSSYRGCLRLREALEQAIPYMPIPIRKEFSVFKNYIQSDMTFDEGLIYLYKRIPNIYIKAFCSILNIAKYKNSDISYQLHSLSLQIRNFVYNKEKSHKKLIFFRILALIFILAIPFIMQLTKLFSTEAYLFYYTLEGSLLFSLTLLSALGAYVFIYFLEITAL